MSLTLFFIIFLFGLTIGSFLNCLIYRLEQGETLNGRSYCPHCKHILSWQDLFPVFSFFILGGKCRYCSKKISWQYPLAEISTALVFLLIFNYQFSIFVPMGHLPKEDNQFLIYQFINLLFLFYVASSLIVIFIYDLKSYIIPDKILFPAILVTFLYQLILNYQFLILNSLWAGMGAALLFLIIFLVSGGRWIGFGDVKLAILLGLLLGFPDILLALFLAFLLGAIIGIGLMIFKRKGLKSQIPFAPFLIAGTLVAMIFGQKIISWYIGIFV